MAGAAGGRRRIAASPGALAGLAGIALMALVSWAAPLLANNKPLMIRWNGATSFPAFRDLAPWGWFLGPDPVSLKLRQDPEWLLRGPAPSDGVASFRLPPVPFSPYQTSLMELHRPPGRASRHYLGTDDAGRDLLARLVHGTRVSLLVGLLAAGVASLLGLAVGGVAGYAGGWVDTLLGSRLIEVMTCFPTFFFLLTVAAVMDPKYLNVWSIMLLIGLTGWPPAARYARAEFLRLKGGDYVLAARSLGAGHGRLAARHILPNALTPLLIHTVFAVAGAILLEAALSFLGVGVQPPEPSWGNLLGQVMRDWSYWWMGVFPGGAIFAAVLSYNLVGEALREALDPRSGG